MRKLLLLLAVVAIVGCQQPIGPSESPSPGILVAVGGGGMISRSTDAGRTWQVSMGTQVKILDYSAYNMKVNQLQVNGEINQGLIAQVQASSNAIAQLNSVGFLGDAYVRGTLYQQLGQQWSGLLTNPVGGPLAITYEPTNAAFLVVGTGGQMTRSVDDGATWSALVANPFGASAINAVSAGGGVVVAGANAGKMARSTDGGATWSALLATPFGAGDNITTVVFGSNVFVAATQTGLISLSTDLGITWSAAIVNPFGGTNILGSAFGNGIFILVGSGPKIARSTDLGVTWGSLITNPFGITTLYTASFNNGVFVAAGGNGVASQLARSVDFGLTWGALITTPLGAATAIGTVGASFSGIFIAGSFGGGIARSYDSGNTWGSLINNPFGANQLNGIAISSDKVVMVGSAGNIATAGWKAALSKYIEQPYTPTLIGFGAPTGIVFTYTIVGNRMKILGAFNSGVTTGVVARISIPNGLSADFSVINSIHPVGMLITTQVQASSFYCLIDPTYPTSITIGVQNVGAGALNSYNGNAIFAGGVAVAIWAELPIAGYNT